MVADRSALPLWFNDPRSPMFRQSTFGRKCGEIHSPWDDNLPFSVRGSSQQEPVRAGSSQINPSIEKFHAEEFATFEHVKTRTSAGRNVAEAIRKA